MHRLLAVLVLSSGCAFGITAPDPGRPRSRAPVCDTGKGPVVLDGAMAATGGIIALSLLEESAGVAVIPAAIGALYLAGALKGNSSANKCREAMSEYDAYLAARGTLDAESPRPLRPGPLRPPAPPSPATTAAGPAPVAPAPATSAPALAPAATAAAPVPARAVAAPAPAPDDDGTWSEFWREVE